MKLLFKYLLLWAVVMMLYACGGKVNSTHESDGDTLQLKYAQYLQLIHHDGFTEALVLNPWSQGKLLHRYLLVPKGKAGDRVVVGLQKTMSDDASPCDVVRIPVTKSVITSSAHCQLLYELACQQAISGVCDLEYMLIPDVQKRASRKSAHGIVNCGSSMQPDIERIMALHPEVILVSPFENSGGYGKLSDMNIPLVEAADYMETSPLGRAEWIKFYAMLFEPSQGDAVASTRAKALFADIERAYLRLKDYASRLPLGYSVLTERKTGGVWYVPGGRSTIGQMLHDAHARYLFADDQHSGSLSMSPEQILAYATEVDVWATKYWGNHPLSRSQLLQEYAGYSLLQAMKTGRVYQASTSSQPYFEETSFHPERLLREFILLSHPEAQKQLGKLRYYQK